MKFNELIENVTDWAIEREIDKENPLSQMQKILEEYGELNEAKHSSNHKELEDAIGDIMVALTVFTVQMNFTKKDIMLNPHRNGYTRYKRGEISTETLLLYATKEIGLMSSKLLDLVFNPGIINTLTQIQFHIRNFTGILSKISVNEGTMLDACFEIAWNEIKDRQGKKINGKWIKEEVQNDK